MRELPDEMTYGESYGPAMRVQTQEEAAEYFAALVRQNIRLTGNSDEEAERVERINIGYWTGYCDTETAARVQALYGFGHPIFGTTRPSPDRALDAGKAFGSLAQANSEATVSVEAFGKAWREANPE